MGFVFLSYLYTLDISGSNNKSPSKDVIIVRKDSIDGFQAEDGEISRNQEGKLLVHISFPEKNKPASVTRHYKSMTTGKVSQAIPVEIYTPPGHLPALGKIFASI